jgi:tRNA-specific 2-thiouridylase
VLRRGLDAQKDQSYFLFGLPEAALDRMIFPLGALQKDETRAHGRRLGIPNADKPDSQELCFVPDGDVAGFVRRSRGEEPAGRLLDTAGQVLGEHAGVSAFTVGQRKGLGLGGGAPTRYVLRIVPDTHDVVVGDADELLGQELEARDVHWLSHVPTEPFRAEVRVRYRHRPAAGVVRPTESGFEVRFDAPQRAISPGQAAVIYRDDAVLGGGFIV